MRVGAGGLEQERRHGCGVEVLASVTELLLALPTVTMAGDATRYHGDPASVGGSIRDTVFGVIRTGQAAMRRSASGAWCLAAGRQRERCHDGDVERKRNAGPPERVSARKHRRCAAATRRENPRAGADKRAQAPANRVAGMSLSGAWRRWLRRPASPPEPSRPAGRAGAPSADQAAPPSGSAPTSLRSRSVAHR